jgi:hypothetical protein
LLERSCDPVRSALVPKIPASQTEFVSQLRLFRAHSSRLRLYSFFCCTEP